MNLRPLCACALFVLATGCSSSRSPHGTLVAPSDEHARARASALLEAAVKRDLAGVTGALCPALAGDARQLLEPGQALAIDGFTLAAVEASWQGAEPVFHVAVDLTRQGAVLPRAVRVRAREGCVDQLLDQPPIGVRPPDPGAISL